VGFVEVQLCAVKKLPISISDVPSTSNNQNLGIAIFIISTGMVLPPSVHERNK